MSRKCTTSYCLNRGKRTNDGWCDRCYWDATLSFERNRRDAEFLTQQTGRNWLVCELIHDCKAVRFARKLGKRAFGVYPAADRASIERDGGYTVVYEHSPEGKVYDAGV